jgi:hypothetical protein
MPGYLGPNSENIEMTVIIKLKMETALALQKRKGKNREAMEISLIAEQIGVVLKPLYPETNDPNLASYFIVEVADMRNAERVITKFNRVKGVEAAYIKPPDELP